MKPGKGGQPPVLSEPEFERSAGKEPQKQTNTLSIADLEGAFSMKYSLAYYYSFV